MTHKKLITWLWLVLLILTLGGSLLGEMSQAGYLLMLFVTLSMAFKGRVVIDHFMELKNAHPFIRNTMQAYFYVLPIVTLVIYLFSSGRL